MAVAITPPKQTQNPDLRAYLRASAQRELDTLKNAKARSMETLPSNDNLPNRSLPTSAGMNMEGGMSAPSVGGYRVSQQYGNYNPGLYGGRTAGARHPGLDIATPAGTPVKSPFTGIVKSGESKTYGKFVEVRTQTGEIMRFSHLNNIDDLVSQLSQAGREIQEGQLLGRTGNTGYSTAPHLDVMYQQGGQWTNPLKYAALEKTLG